MAITNAQQARQLYIKGGKVFPDGRRGFGGGGDMGTVADSKGKTGPSKGGYQGGSGAPGSAESKSSGGDGGYNKNERQLTGDDYKRGKSNFIEQFNDYSGGARIADPDYSTISQRNNQKYKNRIFNTRRNNIISQLSASGLLTPELLKGLEEDDKLYDRDGDGKITKDDLTVENLRDTFQVSTDTVGADYGDRSLNLDALTGIKSIKDYVDDGFYKTGGVFDKNSPKYDPNRIPKPFNEIDVANVKGGLLTKGAATLANFLGEKMAGPLTQEYLDKQFDELEEISSLNYKDDTSIKGLMEKYEPNRFKLENPEPGGGGGGQQQDPCKGPNPPAYCNVGNDTEEDTTPKRNLGGLAPRFAGSIFDFTGLADGGRAGMMDGGIMEDTPEGGIMDLESGRQMYFLGKLVKKATRAVKKVVKSPIGKAALMYFGGKAFMPGGGPGILSNLKTSLIGKLSGGDENIFEGGKFSGLANFLRDQYTSDGGKLKFGLGLGLGVPFALDLLGVGKDKDKKFDINEYYRTQGFGGQAGVDAIRLAGMDGLANRFKVADGGRIGYQEGGDAEPVAKKTMPLLDMDGMEKDYREDGGFVPIGRMERADDVPARLSKNEFVFTADAVRNAGEGDIDKGAEVMYNMMKNLESGGEVSEESQGLDGAREMFKTSQRLEEVL